MHGVSFFTGFLALFFLAWWAVHFRSSICSLRIAIHSASSHSIGLPVFVDSFLAGDAVPLQNCYLSFSLRLLCSQFRSQFSVTMWSQKVVKVLRFSCCLIRLVCTECFPALSCICLVPTLMEQFRVCEVFNFPVRPFGSERERGVVWEWKGTKGCLNNKYYSHFPHFIKQFCVDKIKPEAPSCWPLVERD